MADEVPFDIPDSWEWVRLGSAFAIEMGQSPAGNTVSGNCSGTEFHQGKVFFGEKYIKASDQYTSSPTKFAPKNSVLLCSYARLTAYFGILPTRSPILPERDFTPSSSARGATLAVMASSVSRILPGQEYSIVTAIAAGQAYCNAPPLISQGQKRKMFLTAKKFLKLFFDTKKPPDFFGRVAAQIGC